MSDFEQQSDNYSTDSDIELVSKTRLKKEALALKKFGLELAQLAADKVADLPINDTTKQSILDYQKITTNLAKKRQLMFVGKCLRNEDESEIRSYLSEQKNSNLKAKTVHKDPLQECVEVLLAGSDDAVEKLLSEQVNLERQTLRQLVRNVGNAKGSEKLIQATQKLKVYLKENTSLGNK